MLEYATIADAIFCTVDLNVSASIVEPNIVSSHPLLLGNAEIASTNDFAPSADLDIKSTSIPSAIFAEYATNPLAIYPTNVSNLEKSVEPVILSIQPPSAGNAFTTSTRDLAASAELDMPSVSIPSAIFDEYATNPLAILPDTDSNFEKSIDPVACCIAPPSVGNALYTSTKDFAASAELFIAVISSSVSSPTAFA